MVERFTGTPIRRMSTGGNYVNLTADVVLASDYDDLQRQLAEANERYAREAHAKMVVQEQLAEVRAERDYWRKLHDDRTRFLGAAEAECDRLAAALDDMLFEYGDKYDSECRLKNASELDIIAKARAALDTAKGAER